MGRLHDEMLEAFHELELQDAHIRARREIKAGEQAGTVATSVAFRRMMAGATGVPSAAVERPSMQGSRRVPDPMLTDAEYYHKRGQRPHDPNVGKAWVTENAIERIGALCFIRPPRRQPHHEEAAHRFKSMYEALYGVGSPALDASRVVVDTSPIAHDSGMAGKIDRSGQLRAVEAHDKAMFNRLVALLVLCIPVSEYAPKASSGRTNDRRVKQLVSEALDDLDRLSELWGLQRR